MKKTNESEEIKCTNLTIEEDKRYIVNKKDNINPITQKHYLSYKLYRNKEYKILRKEYLKDKIFKEQYQEEKLKTELMLGSKKLFNSIEERGGRVNNKRKYR